MTETGEIPSRESIDEQFKWDLSPLYADLGSWERDYRQIEEAIPHLGSFKGRLTGSNKVIAEFISSSDELSRKLERVYTWAHLKHDEDLNDPGYRSLHERVVNLMVRIDTETAFFVPEVLSLPEDRISGLMEDPELEFARVPLRSIIRTRDHFLSEKEERLLAMADDVLEASSRTYSLLNDADLRFPFVTDGKLKEVELSHGRFVGLMMDADRDVRKRTMEAYYSSYRSFRNTFTSTLEGELKKRAFGAKVRNYGSALEASLDGDEVTEGLYNSLIDAVHGSIGDFHRYVYLRKRALDVDKLHMYDVYVPLVREFERKIPFDEASSLVLDALAPLGEEVLNIVREGLSSRWIDILESRGKRSGAYSSGCYDSSPYILMNYDENIREVFTLAHEMGHSVHTYLSNKDQPHLTADYRIFVAEVASTINEILLLHHLMNTWTGTDEQTYLVDHYLESFKGTVFRQTMFSEFERDVQAMVEKDTPLTPDLLCEHYGMLNRDYFGPAMIIDPEIELEWARIPHFYYNFYVYKYATSFCAANAIATRILKGDTLQLERYISLLRSGGSKPPVDLLIEAGVDLRTTAPITEALKVFGDLVTRLERLI
ncbi:MAG: oligoendopeptidase F [Candidatus Thermoplasmatota archaeon]|nr:oligoendopeptidase F [Candidatus Thermoplasmatota archaeon]